MSKRTPGPSLGFLRWELLRWVPTEIPTGTIFTPGDVPLHRKLGNGREEEDEKMLGSNGVRRNLRSSTGLKGSRLKMKNRFCVYRGTYGSVHFWNHQQLVVIVSTWTRGYGVRGPGSPCGEPLGRGRRRKRFKDEKVITRLLIESDSLGSRHC